MDYGTNLLTSCSFKPCNTQGRDGRRKDIRVAFSGLGVRSARFQAGPGLSARREQQEFSRGDYNGPLTVSANV